MQNFDHTDHAILCRKLPGEVVMFQTNDVMSSVWFMIWDLAKWIIDSKLGFSNEISFNSS